VWVQDAASSLAVEHLRVMRGGADWVGEGLIVDVCAGQGTKTRQLAAAFPKARIVAADPAPERAKALAEVAARIGDRVKVLPLPEVYRTCRGKAALVLLDVPCTNSGVLARRVEARYRFDREQTARLVETQREIMHSGVGLLSAEGVLCYSTCSIDDAENADQADWLASQGALTLVRSEQTLPAGLPGEPGRLYHDGAFAAVFVRKG
jgi:16S rRNA (cytosine967-C5)-methyltransferase